MYFGPMCYLPTGGNLKFLVIKQIKIWKTKNIEFDQQNLNLNGVGNLIFVNNIMNEINYFNILKENLVQSVTKLCLDRTWVFQ